MTRRSVRNLPRCQPDEGKFEIDPAHYVSPPHLAWEAMLKKTGIVLDLMSDPGMYRTIESGSAVGSA